MGIFACDIYVRLYHTAGAMGNFEMSHCDFNNSISTSILNAKFERFSTL